MHFLLIMFLVVVCANIVYMVTQKVFTLCKLWIPLILCRILLIIATILNEKAERVEEEKRTTKTKTLERWHTGSVRHRIAEYIAYLESGKGYKMTQTIWKGYMTIVPEAYRTIEKKQDALPYWMEQLILLSEQRQARFTLIVLTLFIILVLSSHLWLPYCGFSLKYVSTQEEIQHLLNRSIQSCYNQSTIDTCYLTTDPYTHIGGEALLEVALRTIIFREIGDIKHDPLHLLIDQNNSVHYRMAFRVPTNRIWQYTDASSSNSLEDFFYFLLHSTPEDSLESQWIERYLRVKDDLIPLLEYIHHEELRRGAITQHPCICPVFLNIFANLSFLYDVSETRWLVMAEAVLIRNSTLAELSSSQVGTNERSLFYRRHQHWNRFITESLIHYDSFTIEYTEVESIVYDRPEELAQFNDKLQREMEHPVPRLYHHFRGATEQMAERKQVRLSGIDASCFVYCDTIQKKSYL